MVPDILTEENILVKGDVSLPACPGRTSGLFDRSNAPSMIALEVSLAADGHRVTEEDVGGTNMGLTSANVDPTRQSTSLYPLFNQRNAGLGRQIAAVGRGGDSSTDELAPGS